MHTGDVHGHRCIHVKLGPNQRQNRGMFAQGVSFKGNIVRGEPAGDQTVAVASAKPRPAVYAEPRMRVWRWPGGPTTLTKPVSVTSKFRDKQVKRVVAGMRTAQKVGTSTFADTRLSNVAFFPMRHAVFGGIGSRRLLELEVFFASTPASGTWAHAMYSELICAIGVCKYSCKYPLWGAHACTCAHPHVQRLLRFQ